LRPPEEGRAAIPNGESRLRPVSSCGLDTRSGRKSCRGRRQLLCFLQNGAGRLIAFGFPIFNPVAVFGAVSSNAGNGRAGCALWLLVAHSLSVAFY